MVSLNRNATAIHLSSSADGSSDLGHGDTRHDRTAVKALLGPYSATTEEEPHTTEVDNGYGFLQFSFPNAYYDG